MATKRNYRDGVHYMTYLTGNGHKCYEWLSKETGTVRRWHGLGDYGRTEFLHHFGNDLTVLPSDWCHN